jgi:NADPH:quinone reductase-like Zn-dependent oxidoreductase
MRAVWTTGTNGPDSLEVRETEDPEPAAGQVRIRVSAAGLCFAEVMAAQGLYPGAPKPPAVLCYEAAGVIDKVGPGADERREGSRVVAFTIYGGHSDTVCVPESQAFAIPHGKDFTEAAAMPVNYLTAYHILFRAASIRPGDRVLVHMAAGGLGTAALQLCRTVDGVQTFGTASAAKHEAIRTEGCTHPIDYHTQDYVKEVRRLTDGEGVDVVLDPLGGADSRKGLKLLRPGGRLVTYGFANMTSGEHRNRARVLRQVASVPLLTPLQLMNANKSVAGVHFGRLIGRMDLLTAEFTEVLALWAAGSIIPRIDGTYPFDRE